MKSIQVSRYYFQCYRGVVRYFSGSSAASSLNQASSTNVNKPINCWTVETSTKNASVLPRQIDLSESKEMLLSDRYVNQINTIQQMHRMLNEQPVQQELMTIPDKVECAIHECPDSIKKEFTDLFPDRNLQSNDLTVITLTHKTDNDMSVWNQNVEKEREELMETFVHTARNVCEQLRQAGYWADFIDPYTGTPHLSGHTNSTFEETDPRNRYFGITIEDLGCCRVIQHLKWGTHAFVGVLFTNVPAGHSLLNVI